MEAALSPIPIDHTFVTVSRSYETITTWTLFNHRVLHHTEEVLVCTKCGKVVNPWEKEDDNG